MELTPNDGPPPEPAEPARADLYQDRYELGPMLGRGGSCAVYRAWDSRLQRHVAIKRLQPPLTDDPHARARFNREGRAIAKLSHPHLVTLIDRGSTEDEEYLVFEYVEGRSLKDLIKQSGPLRPLDAVRVAGQVAEGLAQAHELGIVHRDVKPQNILLDAEGRAKLTDFGIATADDWTRVTQAGSIVGSSRYMSPEQVQGRPVDGRSDVYSLGIVLYEMLAGTPPFNGANIAEIARQHVRVRPDPLAEVRPGLPAGLDRVVLRCLEKLPENRFQSMDELLGAFVGLDLYDLERHAAGGILGTLRRVAGRDPLSDSGAWVPPDEDISFESEPVSPPPLPARIRQERARARSTAPRRRPAGPWVLVGALAVVLVVAGWLVLRPGRGPVPDVTGRSLEQAKSLAAEAGYRLVLDGSQQPSVDSTAGRILSQTPAAGSEGPDDMLRVKASREALAVVVKNLQDTDPGGDQEERRDLLPRLTDGNEESVWSTEQYRSADFGGLKEGVGIAFDLEEPAALLQVVSPDTGWAGQVQIQAEDGSWQTVAPLSGRLNEAVLLDPEARQGRIWITRLAATENERFAVRIGELGFFK